MAGRFIVGLLLNVLILGTGIYLAARTLGWIYGSWQPQFRSAWSGSSSVCADPACTRYKILQSTPHLPGWLGLLTLSLLGATVIAGVIWGGNLLHIPERMKTHLGYIAGGFVALTLLAAIFAVAIPHLLEFVRVSLPRYGLGKQSFAGPAGVQAGTTRQATRTITWGAIIALATTIGTGIATILTAAKAVPDGVEQAALSFLRRTLQKLRVPLLNLAAAITVPLLGVLVALAGIVWGAGAPPWEPHTNLLWDLVIWWVLPAGLFLFLWRTANITEWSLYPFYRRRLAAAFNLQRVAPPAWGLSPIAVQGPDHEKVDVEERSDEQTGRLSESQADSIPTLLVCAAANISDYGVTPTGSNVTSFVFSSQWIGGPTVGAMPTEAYEKRTANYAQELKLPAAMAMSGAALAPSMGKLTRRPLRMLLAIGNVRLGVWLPNPRLVAGGVGLKKPRHAVDDETYNYLSRPRPDYLVKELTGRNRVDARFLYITDGGHYENLGLVELLRRGCQWVWCIDAAGDPTGSFSTLGQAIALANAELGVEVTIDPEVAIVPEADPGDDGNPNNPLLVKDVWRRGTIRYADGSKGTLIYIRAAVSRDAPWSVRAFQHRFPAFPNDPTANQLYDGERFDAYRILGSFAVQRAWEGCHQEFDQFRGRPAPNQEVPVTPADPKAQTATRPPDGATRGRPSRRVRRFASAVAGIMTGPGLGYGAGFLRRHPEASPERAERS